LESPAVENPKVETLDWTGRREGQVQSKVSTFGFSTAGLSNFRFPFFQAIG